MSEYAKIWQRIWDDDDFVALPPDTQAVYFLLISDPGRTNAGILPLTINRWSRCSAGTTPDTMRGHLNMLVARNFIVVDWEYEELLVRTFIRNDQGYLHTNIHKSVIRAALKVRSPRLKSVLAEELLRLPDHNGVKTTRETAEALVKGLKESHLDAIGMPSESHSDAVEIVRVEGCTYVSSKENNLQPQPSTFNGNRSADRAGAAHRQNTASDMVLRVIPAEHPRKVKEQLRNNAAALMSDGTDPDLVEAALRLWNDRGISAPGLLPSLVSDVIKQRSGGTPTLQGADRKAAGYFAVAQQRNQNALEIER